MVMVAEMGHLGCPTVNREPILGVSHEKKKSWRAPLEGFFVVDYSN